MQLLAALAALLPPDALPAADTVAASLAAAGVGPGLGSEAELEALVRAEEGAHNLALRTVALHALHALAGLDGAPPAACERFLALCRDQRDDLAPRASLLAGELLAADAAAALRGPWLVAPLVAAAAAAAGSDDAVGAHPAVFAARVAPLVVPVDAALASELVGPALALLASDDPGLRRAASVELVPALLAAPGSPIDQQRLWTEGIVAPLGAADSAVRQDAMAYACRHAEALFAQPDIVDLRTEPVFWRTVVQEGLLSPDAVVNKRAVYLLQAAIRAADNGAAPAQAWLPEFAWPAGGSAACGAARAFWSTFLHLFDRLCDFSVHVIRSDWFALDRYLPQPGRTIGYAPHSSWLHILLRRAMLHPNRRVRKFVLLWVMSEVDGEAATKVAAGSPLPVRPRDFAPLLDVITPEFVGVWVIRALADTNLYRLADFSVHRDGFGGVVRDFVCAYARALPGSTRMSFVHSILGTFVAESLSGVELAHVLAALPEIEHEPADRTPDIMVFQRMAVRVVYNAPLNSDATAEMRDIMLCDLLRAMCGMSRPAFTLETASVLGSFPVRIFGSLRERRALAQFQEWATASTDVLPDLVREYVADGSDLASTAAGLAHLLAHAEADAALAALEPARAVLASAFEDTYARQERAAAAVRLLYHLDAAGGGAATRAVLKQIMAGAFSFAVCQMRSLVEPDCWTDASVLCAILERCDDLAKLLALFAPFSKPWRGLALALAEAARKLLAWDRGGWQRTAAVVCWTRAASALLSGWAVGTHGGDAAGDWAPDLFALLANDALMVQHGGLRGAPEGALPARSSLMVLLRTHRVDRWEALSALWSAVPVPGADSREQLTALLIEHAGAQTDSTLEPFLALGRLAVPEMVAAGHLDALRDLAERSLQALTDVEQLRVRQATLFVEMVLQPCVMAKAELIEGPDSLVQTLTRELLAVGEERRNVVNAVAAQLTKVLREHEATVPHFLDTLVALAMFASTQDRDDAELIRFPGAREAGEDVRDPDAPDSEIVPMFMSSDLFARAEAVVFVEDRLVRAAPELCHALIRATFDVLVREGTTILPKPNSFQHRLRVRAWQLLLVLGRTDLRELPDDLTSKYLELLGSPNPPVIRMFVEAFGIQLYLQRPELFDTSLLAVFGGDRNASALIGSAFLIAAHVAVLSEGARQADVWPRVLQHVYPYLATHHIGLRWIGQLGMLRMSQHWMANAALRASVGDGGLVGMLDGLGAFLSVERSVEKLMEKVRGIDSVDRSPLAYTLGDIFDKATIVSGCFRDVIAADVFAMVREQPGVVDAFHYRFRLGIGMLTAPATIEESRADEGAAPMDNFQEKLRPFGATDTVSRDTIQRQDLILVASLVDRMPNLGGLCRTCEIFSARKMVISNHRVLQSAVFTQLAVSSDKWVAFEEVGEAALAAYLMDCRARGYSILGVEQTTKSVSLVDFEFPRRCVLLLGREREGIPVELLQLVDHCIEIPQLGVTRSLNVHVTGALIMWEYTRQGLLTEGQRD